MLKELLYKLDLIAPASMVLFSASNFLVRKGVISFSDKILIVFAFVQLLLNGKAAQIQVLGGNNLWVYHVNCITTCLLFTVYFFKTLRQTKFIYTGFIFFVAAYILLTLYTQTYNGFPSYTLALASGVIVIYGLLLLDEMMTHLPTGHILTLKEFWMLAGILAYFGSSFFIFISYNHLSLILSKRVSILWQAHNLFLFIGCVLFMISINRRKWILK